ncbi:pyruvate kinase [Gluconacetobacter azotocaptans]|uniref:Pyruvate kinase n=1 Tax=Gluconacetobacter azotocaptans TaxID=142834 RepID=A0A7W4JQW5_9PROT|nr:pyruvate kinase [Gluconacetobacter azotocaptans]MBB2189263.1 pyruvate kinase [Gluconacetobacter azotocaptans]MBM9402114.1 pyruvate kinase [Gluconacetobacter azotocaptans]
MTIVSAPRPRRTKIVSTLGPASSDAATIRALAEAGADVFRLNFSHGTHADHAARHEIIRSVEAELGRPIGILADVQGPKLRVGTFENGRVTLETGAAFRLDLDDTPGTAARVRLPHPEIIHAANVGSNLLLDDGKLRLVVSATGPDHLDTIVAVGGVLSDRKGVNVPDIVLPIPALTPKDRKDLDFALELGVEYIGLSFVQRPEDVEEARAIAGGRAWIMTKVEKPQAMDNLDEIVRLSDAVMVARGDLGVELPPEAVPLAQKRIIRVARQMGKPVVVATQMLESMISAPTPTRAEASDVATAVFDGADAVMLSAETAAGQFPLEAVGIMNRIVSRVEDDAVWLSIMQASCPAPEGYVADAIAAAAGQIATTVNARAIVAFTLAGATALRISRERPSCPIIGLTPTDEIARRLCVVWGVLAQSVGQETPVRTVETVVDQAVEAAVSSGLARSGDNVVIAAGLPFGVAGSTNTLRVARVP